MGTVVLMSEGPDICVPHMGSGEREKPARKRGLIISDMYFGSGIKVLNLKLEEYRKPTKYPSLGE